MALSLQNFDTMRQNFASSVQGACRYLVDFSPGSILLAVAEASGSVGLWMQWLILQVLAKTRLATSNGTDCDTFVSDFTLTRLPATFASGTVTFSRFSATVATLIVPGTQVKTLDGTQVFTVIADTTQAAWSVALGGYSLPISTASADVTVLASTGGTIGNVQPNTITLIASAIPFVDTVTNSAGFINGVDAETDAALRARFALFMQTRSQATVAAVQYVISLIRQGLNATIQENVNAIGTYTPGSFVVTIDDGTGAPSSDLLAQVSAAVAAIRPVGSVWTVQGPTDTTATITLTITCNPTASKAALLAPVRNAIIAYVNALPVGAPLPYSRLAGIAYSVDPSIVDVTSVLLNTATADIVPAANGAVKATTGSVTIS